MFSPQVHALQKDNAAVHRMLVIKDKRVMELENARFKERTTFDNQMRWQRDQLGERH